MQHLNDPSQVLLDISDEPCLMLLPFRLQEDDVLRDLVNEHGPKKWSLIAQQLGTKGSKQVRWTARFDILRTSNLKLNRVLRSVGGGGRTT